MGDNLNKAGSCFAMERKSVLLDFFKAKCVVHFPEVSVIPAICIFTDSRA